MSSSTLPMVDISPFLDPSSTLESRRSTADSIHVACSTIGFFYLCGHGVPVEEMSAIVEVTRTFLVESTQEEKDLLSISANDFARGYQRRGENVTGGKADWHEALDLYAPSPFGEQGCGRVLGGSNRFPNKPAAFKEVVDSWVTRMCMLGEVVMRATAMGLGMGSDEVEELLDQVRDSFWVLRCIGYPPLPPSHDGVSCGAHKDYGCYTFLHSDSTRGALQVFVPGKSGEGSGHWIAADPIEGAFVVNIGEMWETWTNGLYKATLHRVIHKGNNYRVSVPFFYEPAFDAIISPLPAALKLQESNYGPVKVVKEPVKYGDFLLAKVGGNFSVTSDDQVRSRY